MLALLAVGDSFSPAAVVGFGVCTAGALLFRLSKSGLSPLEAAAPLARCAGALRWRRLDEQ